MRRTPAVDRTVAAGDTVMLGDLAAQVIDVGGHTMGHIAYHLPQAALAFVGDSLFALGCAGGCSKVRPTSSGPVSPG